jgi:hypothetical protein
MEDLRVSDLKERLKPIVDTIKKYVSDNPDDVEYLIDYALKELLYPRKRLAKDRIIPKDFGRWESKVVDPKDVPFKSKFKNSEVVAVEDTRPCDTEPPSNLINVDFRPDE